MAWYVGRVPGESDERYNAAVEHANAMLKFLGWVGLAVVMGVGAILFFAH